MSRSIPYLLLIGLLGFAPASAWASGDDSHEEILLTRAMQAVADGDLDRALREVDAALATHPDFHLAHLVRGDILLARSRPLQDVGGATAGGERLGELRDEARLRLAGLREVAPANHFPRQILRLAPSQRYALLADASRARLYVFENVEGMPRLIRHFYMTVGRNGVDKRVEGDKKTPLGVYVVTQHIPRARLTDFYGAGAFPLDYPNDWDRTLGRTGYGIWLHGVPADTYSRPPRASDGCVVFANSDFTELARYIEPGVTPVVIAERMEWLPEAEWLAARSNLLAKLDNWKADWERLDQDGFLTHYSARFLSSEGRGWVESKRRNIGNKDWIKLHLSDISLFLHSSDNLAVVTFNQNYDSNSFRSMSRKRLHLALEEGEWRIALERSLQSLPLVAARETSNDAP